MYQMPKKFKFLLAFAFCLLFVLVPSSVSAADIFWSTPTKINTTTNNAILPTIVTGPNGYLHSAWMELPEGNENFYGYQNPGIYYSVWNGDVWATPTKVSQNTGFASMPGVAVTSNNNVHVVWDDGSESPSGSWGRILYSQYGGSWSTPVSLSASLDLEDSWAWDAEIVRDAADNLHVIFDHNAPNQAGINELYYLKWNGSSWSTPTKLTVKGSDDNIQYSALTVDSSNNPHVILWEGGRGSWDMVRGIYHTNFNGTSWTTPFKLSIAKEYTEESGYPKIVIDGNNYRHVIWVTTWYDYPNQVWKNRVEYVKWTGSWSSAITITPDANYSYWGVPITGVTYDSQNNVYVGWGERAGWPGAPDPEWKGVQVSYKKWSSSIGTWSDSVFMRYVYDLDSPFLYKDKWDNQHFTWSEQNSVTNGWEFWYATVPVNAQFYNPASAFDMTLNITGDTLSIPAGALAQSATISAQIGPLPASADPLYTTLPRSFTYRPHGITFAARKEATAVINYSDAEVIGSDERNMKVYIWDGTLNAWSTSYTTKMNTALNTATVTLPHFSLYGVMIPKVKTTWLEPLTEEKPFRAGSTIVIKFKLAYADGSALDVREDVGVVVLGPGDYEVFSFDMTSKGAEALRYDVETGQFIATFRTKDLPVGDYQIQATLAGNPVGEFPLNLTSAPGKTR